MQNGHVLDVHLSIPSSCSIVKLVIIDIIAMHTLIMTLTIRLLLVLVLLITNHLREVKIVWTVVLMGVQQVIILTREEMVIPLEDSSVHPTVELVYKYKSATVMVDEGFHPSSLLSAEGYIVILNQTLCYSHPDCIDRWLTCNGCCPISKYSITFSD